jgi:hypothetical protein
MAQVMTGFQFPNAVIAVRARGPRQASIDIVALERRRDWVLSAPGHMGYETVRPEAPSPWSSGSRWATTRAFAALLAEHDRHGGRGHIGVPERRVLPGP